MLTVDLKRFPLLAGERILDLGCGEGRHVNTFYYLAPIDSVGVDLSLQDVTTAKQRAADLVPLATAEGSQEVVQNDQHRILHLVANGLRLPFADQSFDKIICSEVLEHVPDYQSVIAEISRILKPGGTLCVSVPRYWPEKICWWLSDAYHQVEGGHLRIFKSAQLKAEINSEGFKFLSRHWAHALHAPFWWLKCLLWKQRDTHFLIKLYHRFLVWDLMQRPLFSRALEACLNPFLGKSVVLYFKKDN